MRVQLPHLLLFTIAHFGVQKIKDHRGNLRLNYTLFMTSTCTSQVYPLSTPNPMRNCLESLIIYCSDSAARFNIPSSRSQSSEYIFQHQRCYEWSKTVLHIAVSLLVCVVAWHLPDVAVQRCLCVQSGLGDGPFPTEFPIFLEGLVGPYFPILFP